MKKTIFLLIVFSITWKNLFSCNDSLNRHDSINNDSVCFQSKKVQAVYVCLGQYAYAYHSYQTCPGLNNCQSSVITVEQSTAIYTYKRKACCRCWSNVAYNCYDDNPNNSGGGYGGGGGGGDGLAIIGCAIAATSVIILSNEFYIAPAVSFYKGKKYLSDNIRKIKQKPALGITFHLRKNFKNSGLEYGVSYFKYERTIYYEEPSYSNHGASEKIGGYLNYVHNVLKQKIPEKYTLFCGPTVKYVDDFGFGGIVGGSIKVHDRIKFDLRYELSTQSNQIQLGLQILYQKVYFWKKRKQQ
jgi:hypothetical protein